MHEYILKFDNLTEIENFYRFVNNTSLIKKIINEYNGLPEFTSINTYKMLKDKFIRDEDNELNIKISLKQKKHFFRLVNLLSLYFLYKKYFEKEINDDFLELYIKKIKMTRLIESIVEIYLIDNNVLNIKLFEKFNLKGIDEDITKITKLLDLKKMERQKVNDQKIALKKYITQELKKKDFNFDDYKVLTFNIEEDKPQLINLNGKSLDFTNSEKEILLSFSNTNKKGISDVELLENSLLFVLITTFVLDTKKLIIPQEFKSFYSYIKEMNDFKELNYDIEIILEEVK